MEVEERGANVYPPEEVSLFLETVFRFQPDAVFELATNVGRSARIFWEAVRAAASSTKIYSIDLRSASEYAGENIPAKWFMVPMWFCLKATASIQPYVCGAPCKHPGLGL